MKKSLPFVSIIILNYNSEKYLYDCLESVFKINYPKAKFEVILADNNSSKNFDREIKDFKKMIKVLRLGKNYGYAKGNNLASKEAKGDYFLFLNPDTKIDKNYFREIIKEIKQNIFSYCGKILFMDNLDLINSTGLLMTPIGVGIDRGINEKDGLKQYSKYIASASGAAFFCNALVFKKLGGFDENYFAYVEELDLGYRGWINGYSSIFIPKAVVHHKVGGVFGNTESPLRVYYSRRNGLSTMLKNFRSIDLINGFIISLSLDATRLIKYLKNKEFNKISSLSRAYFDFFYNSNKTIEKRTPMSLPQKSDIHVSLLDSIKETKRLEK